MSIPFLNRLTRGLIPLCLVLALPAQATTTQVTGTKHPFLWRIDGKGNKTFATRSWLYGTMHLGDERLLTLPDPVEEARESADALYCELAMDQMQKQQQKLLLKMLLPRGQTLEDRLPEKLYQRLSDYVASRGGSMLTMDRLQVWAVNLNLALIEATKEKMTQSLDLMIYKDAKSDGKEVGGLETMDEQLDAMADMPEADHVKMLVHSLDYMEKLIARGVSPLRRMLNVYLTGDEDKLLAVAKESMIGDKELLEKFMKPMIVDRNIRMADRMAKKMEEHPEKSYFFAAGAMHYPGKDGIVVLLRKKGYRITRIGAPKKEEAENTATRPARRRLERVGR